MSSVARDVDSPGLFQALSWQRKAAAALVVAVVAGLLGTAVYGDASGARVPLLSVASFDAFYTVRSLERFVAAVLLTVSAVAWLVFLTIVATVVALDTLDTVRRQQDAEESEEFADLDDGAADI
jgi:hypothetical protein